MANKILAKNKKGKVVGYIELKKMVVSDMLSAHLLEKK